MTGTASENMPSNLPAQYLAYKQKSQEQKQASSFSSSSYSSSSSSMEPGKIGNTNCWGSFMQFQMLADPRSNTTTTSSSSSSHLQNSPNGQTNRNSDDAGMTAPEGVASFSSSSSSSSSSHPSGRPSEGGSDDKSKSSLWSRVSGPFGSSGAAAGTTTTIARSAELEKKNPSDPTNAELLKSMAASSVRRPEIPQIGTAAAAGGQRAAGPPAFRSQSSFPSLASSVSDGSMSMDSSQYSGPSSSSSPSPSRFWNIGRYFSRDNGKKEAMMGYVGSGDQDPSFGEMPGDKKRGDGAKKDGGLDVEKLKRLRDQAAGLVPRSPPVGDKEEERQRVSPAAAAATTTSSFESFESQIDDMEQELYKAAAAPGGSGRSGGGPPPPPHLRMDGFDDVHDGRIGELPGRAMAARPL